MQLHIEERLRVVERVNFRPPRVPLPLGQSGSDARLCCGAASPQRTGVLISLRTAMGGAPALARTEHGPQPRHPMRHAPFHPSRVVPNSDDLNAVTTSDKGGGGALVCGSLSLSRDPLSQALLHQLQL